MPRKPTNWPPAEKPANFEFSRHKFGWAKWYAGRTWIIPLKTLDREAVRKAWHEKRIEIDRRAAGDAKVDPSRITIRQAASQFYEFLHHRLTTGKPDPISPYTVADYERWINQFGRCVGPDIPLASLGPDEFGTFAKTIAAHAPATVHRVISYVLAFIRFAVDEGVIEYPPQFGRYFAKPSRQSLRDKRLSIQKAYGLEDIRKVYSLARADERLWIVLGLCGAMDNADIANLTRTELDRDAGTIDYRRRKKGRVRRAIPMPVEFWKMLDAYHRPAAASPADNNRVFLTPNGLPLQRLNKSSVDYVAMRWNRLCIKAGLKPPMPRRRDAAHRELPKRIKAKGGTSGKGFRSLRTTFPNLAPPGFRDEIEVIMGHKNGGVLVENYLERFGMDRLVELVNHVWSVANFTLPPPLDAVHSSSVDATADDVSPSSADMPGSS